MRRNLLMIAGIAGNELWALGNPFFGDLRVWLNEPALLVGAWRGLGLGPDGVSPAIAGTPPLVGLRLLPPYYGGLADYFRSQGWTVWDLYQDWRLSIDRCYQEVASILGRLAADGPAAVVCHSRGGLVMRAALQHMTETQRGQYVSRVVGLGVPHYGAWSACGLVGGWNSVVAQLRLFLEHAPYLVAGGLYPGGLQAVVNSWPAVYELFPRPGAPGVDPATIDAVYNPANWSAAGVQLNDAWLAAAGLRWPEQQFAPDDVLWLDVFGDGLPTPTALADVAELGHARGFTWTTAGDGTVPAAWAVQPGRPRLATGLAHDQLIYGGALAERINAYLLGAW